MYYKQVINDATLLLGSYEVDSDVATRIIDEMISEFDKHPEIARDKLPRWKAARNYLKSWHSRNKRKYEMAIKNANSL